MENITAGNEAQGIEDMIHLDTMSEETILKNLGVRYSRDQIYVRSKTKSPRQRAFRLFLYSFFKIISLFIRLTLHGSCRLKN
jgi:hypothetical protein